MSATHRALTSGLIVTALVAGVMTVTPSTPTAVAGDCPTSVDPADFASPDELRAATKVMADFGPRPTGSPSHTGYIDSIERELRTIDGFEISELPEELDLQLERSATLTISDAAGSERLPVAGAVPYAAPTPGVTGRLVHVPEGTPISEADVDGAVVVREAATGSVQFAIFLAVAYYVHDPDLSIDLLENYERDNFGYVQRITDLRDAAEHGAAALVFVHDFPRQQVAGQYAPYDGDHWQVPAVYVGVDEGTELIRRASDEAEVTIRTTATQRAATTRSLVATLPGQTDERVVIQSHTDGMNAIWDNGPAAMLAMAEYFADLPTQCRSRTLQFVFTTAHLHLCRSGAYHFAEILDNEYDSGTVALVVAIEHLGAKEFAAVPRPDGPGRTLEPTGRSEPFVAFSMESPVLVETMINRIVARDLRRTFLLRGADAPQVGFPPHRSFGGEGGPYREFLVPTIAGITGPWTLYNPSFEMDDIVDFELMRRQTLAYADVVLAVDEIPRHVIAGADTVYRAGRDLLTQGPPEPLSCDPAHDDHAESSTPLVDDITAIAEDR